MDFDGRPAPMLHYTPRIQQIPWVVRGRAMEERLFQISIRSLHDAPVLPVFVTSACYLTVGGQGQAINDLPEELDDGRDVWRATQLLEPGEMRDFVVYLDPAHGEFPPVGDRGVQLTLEVAVEIDGRQIPVGTLPIVLDEVLGDLPDYAGVIALDFGTSNSCAVASPTSVWKPHVIQLEEAAEARVAEVPSLIAYYDVADPARPVYAIGREARLRFGQVGADQVISSVKRYVGSDSKFLVGSDAGRQAVFYNAASVAAHVVNRVKSRIEAQLGNRAVVQLVCTYPTAFSKHQVDALSSIFADVQSAVARRLGVTTTAHRMVLDEATAASLFYLQHRFQDLSQVRDKVQGDEFTMLCYDLGGGTTDLSITRFRIADAPDGRGLKLSGSSVAQDGLASYGGDNMTLAVYRLLKVRYALKLARLLKDRLEEEVRSELTESLAEPTRAILAEAAALENWASVGNTLAADPSIGFAGYEGVELEADTWEAVDALVPTRFHETFRHTGEQREARHEVFYDLWQAAENAKKNFGTPAPDGAYPQTTEPPPPAGLLGRFDIGPEMLRIELSMDEVRNHLEPWLALSFAKARTIAIEAGLDSVHFFVMAGNACRLPLVQELLAKHLAVIGARAENVLFDPAVAKTAVATGACMLAVHQAAQSEVNLEFEPQESTLRDIIGTLEAPVMFSGTDMRMQRWFDRGVSVPAVSSMQVPPDCTRLNVVSLRRERGNYLSLGQFCFDRDRFRGDWANLPRDLREAVDELGLAEDTVRHGVEPTRSRVVIAGTHHLYLLHGHEWLALWPRRFKIPDEQDTFSGKH